MEVWPGGWGRQSVGRLRVAPCSSLSAPALRAGLWVPGGAADPRDPSQNTCGCLFTGSLSPHPCPASREPVRKHVYLPRSFYFQGALPPQAGRAEM